MPHVTGSLPAQPPYERVATTAIIRRWRRPRGHRRAGQWMLVSLIAVAVVAGCGVPASSLVPLGPGIAVPAEELRPVDRCIFEAGFRATAVHPARSGSNGVYSWV